MSKIIVKKNKDEAKKQVKKRNEKPSETQQQNEKSLSFSNFLKNEKYD